MISDAYAGTGGFVAGLVIPHEGGFAIAVTEKLEDFVSIIFLPLVSPRNAFNSPEHAH